MALAVRQLVGRRFASRRGIPSFSRRCVMAHTEQSNRSASSWRVAPRSYATRMCIEFSARVFGRAVMLLSSMNAAMFRLETLKCLASSDWESPEA